MRRHRLRLAAAALVLACAGALAPVHAPEASGQSLTCSSGTAVPDPANAAALVGDCNTLLAMKDTLAGTGTLNWSAALAMTEWTGVIISGGRVTELRLSNRALTGTIPSGLGSLSGLIAVSMTANRLTGSIPSSIGSLTNLRYLSLAFNDLEEQLPTQLGNLSNLEWLTLTSNDFSGSIPASFGNLTNLRGLEMSGNGPLGNIPAELGGLSNLEELHLLSNGHTGSIPSELGNLTNLKVLRLSINALTGSVPSSLGGLTELTVLELAFNGLSGDIPLELDDLTKLRKLELADNELTGCVPGSLSFVQEHDLELLRLPYCRAKPIFAISETGMRSVAENSTVGTAVGASFSAVDRDGDGLTYSLGGTDVGNFSIDASTGQVTVAAALDRETQETHSLTVSVHDGTDYEGNDDTSIDTTIDVTVTILDVDEAPVLSGSSSASTVEHADTVLGNFSADDPEGDQISWSVGGDDGHVFVIDDQGALRFGIPPDYERPVDRGKDNNYSLLVRAADRSNTTSFAVTVSVTAIDEAPVLTGPRAIDVSENSAGELGRYRATDPEGATAAMTLSGSDAGLLSLSDSGVLSFDSAPDYEQPGDADTDGTYDVTVEAFDGSLRTTRSVRVAVRDLNEELTVSGDTAIERDEISTDETSIIGQYSAADPESAEIAWSVAGADIADFTIDSAGALRFVASPDYEDPEDRNGDNVYQLTVRAFDGDNTGSLAVSVSVSNGDESPYLRSSGLHPQVGTTLYLSLEDADGPVSGAAWTWERSTDNVSWSAISAATTSRYSPATGDESYYLRASVGYSDPEGSGKSAQYTWDSATRAAPSSNVAPHFDTTEAAQLTVEQTAAVGSAVGLPVTATDADGQPLTYSVGGQGRRWFGIDAGTGQIRTRLPLIRYPGTSFRLLLTASDPSDLRVTRPVIITVSDSPEAPRLRGPHVVHVDEGQSTRVALYIASDPDGSQLTWSVTGTDRDDLFVDSQGVLRFQSYPDADAPVDADLDNIYQVSVEVSDGARTATIGVRVVVSDLDEPGSVTLSGDDPRPGTTLDASLEDADGGVQDVSWEWQRRGPGGVWTPIPSADSSAYTVSRADQGYALRAEAVYDDAHGSAKSEVSAPRTADRIVAPGAPRNVVAVPGDGSASVSWIAPSSTGGSPSLEYEVVAFPDGATCTTTGAVSCVVSGLDNGTTYTFTVTARNDAGASPRSARSAPVKPHTVPGAPVGVTAGSFEDGQSRGSWQRPEFDGGVSISDYTVTASPGGRSCTTTGSRGLYCTVIGLVNGTEYRFTVTARNTAGSSPPSASVTATPAAAPGAPTAVTATAGDRQASISWTAPATTGGFAIVGYTVTAAPGGQTCTTGGAVSCVVSNLQSGRSYAFTVTAANAAQRVSPPSVASTPVLVPARTPGAPTAVTATAGNGDARVS